MQKVSYVHRGTEASRSSDCDESQVPFASAPQGEGEHPVRSFERAIEDLGVNRFEQDLRRRSGRSADAREREVVLEVDLVVDFAVV